MKRLKIEALSESENRRKAIKHYEYLLNVGQNQIDTINQSMVQIRLKKEELEHGKD